MHGELSWWLEEGTEQCGHCFGWFHYEAVSFCAACDCPLCPACTVGLKIEEAVLCPACHETKGC
ncbi:MAG: hypothetical protein M0P57_08845 [Syntrophales bacterium]|nr:hypothetical protein [Syntrophales bacterium]